MYKSSPIKTCMCVFGAVGVWVGEREKSSYIIKLFSPSLSAL